MFLFRFVKYLSFRKNGRTPEWEESYQRLCSLSDYEYMRKMELKSFKSTAILLCIYCICLWWAAFHPWFSSMGMYSFASIFTIILSLYFLNIYTYIPMEIKETYTYSKISASRRPSSVVRKKMHLKEIEAEHTYYIYTTEDHKKCIDMTDRIFGDDQNYEDGTPVFRFTGPNNNHDYILPAIFPNNE